MASDIKIRNESNHMIIWYVDNFVFLSPASSFDVGGSRLESRYVHNIV
jgi:hypothetical protein